MVAILTFYLHYDEFDYLGQGWLGMGLLCSGWCACTLTCSPHQSSLKVLLAGHKSNPNKQNCQQIQHFSNQFLQKHIHPESYKIMSTTMNYITQN